MSENYDTKRQQIRHRVSLSVPLLTGVFAMRLPEFYGIFFIEYSEKVHFLKHIFEVTHKNNWV